MGIQSITMGLIAKLLGVEETPEPSNCCIEEFLHEKNKGLMADMYQELKKIERYDIKNDVYSFDGIEYRSIRDNYFFPRSNE